MKLEKGGCRNRFGVTTKNQKIENIECIFPEILKAKSDMIKEYYVNFRSRSGGHGGGIITVKLDCDNWNVTIYKDYEKVIKHEEIKPYVPYWIYINYCATGDQLFEIINTNHEKLNNFEFGLNLKRVFADETF